MKRHRIFMLFIPFIYLYLLVTFFFGSPWGYMISKIKSQQYIDNTFPGIRITHDDSVRYFSPWESYVLKWYDEEHHFSFLTWYDLYTDEFFDNYVAKKWGQEIQDYFSQKYPQYIFSVYTPNYGRFRGILYQFKQEPYSVSAFSSPLMRSVGYSINVETKEDLSLGISDQMRTFLLDFHSVFTSDSFFFLDIYHESGEIDIDIHNLSEFLNEENIN